MPEPPGQTATCKIPRSHQLDRLLENGIRKLSPRRVIGRQQIEGRNNLETSPFYEGTAQDPNGLDETHYQDMSAATKAVMILVAGICRRRVM